MRLSSKCLAVLLALATMLPSACALSKKVEKLFDAVAQDSPKKIGKALKKGADINAIGPGGQTPLMNAVLTGKVRAVKALLKRGADTTIGEKDGYTPMHGAGFQGRHEIAKLLINHGLDAHDEHTDGYQPIHRACWGGEERHTDTVGVFLRAGVDPRVEARNGQQPLKMAAGNMKTARLLQKHIKMKDDEAEVKSIQSSLEGILKGDTDPTLPELEALKKRAAKVGAFDERDELAQLIQKVQAGESKASGKDDL